MFRCLKNNKGYMLVEIILAFALAMIIMFFMTELTIKLKNKNDDMLVRTLVSTDQAIIYNAIMRNLYENGDHNGSSYIDCDYINSSFEVDVSNNVFRDISNDFKNIVNEYVKLGPIQCSGEYNDISITVPLNDPQLGRFDVKIDFNSNYYEY